MQLIRYAFFEDRVLGLLINGEESYYTIEKPWRHNEPFKSCIPEGDYTLERVNSPRFGEDVWQVAEVPGRTHILIHVANYSADVVGCIGLGRGVFADFGGVSNSRQAILGFYEQTEDATTLNLTISSGAIKWMTND
jgi:hypothetical protein